MDRVGVGRGVLLCEIRKLYNCVGVYAKTHPPPPTHPVLLSEKSEISLLILAGERERSIPSDPRGFRNRREALFLFSLHSLSW